jgi:vitamin-K-epoxide reductase (warfarin-sensitive)
VPVAVLGLAAYAAILATALVRAPAAALAGAALAVAGLVFAAYLLGVQAFVLDAYCTWCLASDAVLALLAVLTVIRAARV